MAVGRWILGNAMRGLRRSYSCVASASVALVAACGARTGLDAPLPIEAGLVDGVSASPSEAGSSSGGGSSSGSSSDASGQGEGGYDAGVEASVDAGIIPPPSCAADGGGGTQCGVSGENCCISPQVEAGTFYRTYTNNGSGPTGEGAPATVSEFSLDRYEVTVSRFRRFVSAWNGGAGYVPPAGSGKHSYLNGGLGLANSASPGTYETGWLASDDANIAANDDNLGACVPFATWTPTPGTQENLPINCVNWYEAYAFCIWDGGFLPSETEWEYAAAGGSQEREYPWGNTPPSSYEYAIARCDYPSQTPQCTGVANIAPVGTAVLGVGLDGQLDLAGSVAEWVLDSHAVYVNPCIDCGYLMQGQREIRGGWFSGGALFPWARDFFTQEYYRNYSVGIRCARAP